MSSKQSQQSQIQMPFPLQLAPSMQDMLSSATLAINEAVAARRAAGQKTIHLGFGEASFPLHPLLRGALNAAAEQTGYAPVPGIAALRQAIADYLTRTRHLETTAASIAVGPGSKPLIYTLLHILDGDLLLPAPSWVSYAPHARLAGKQIIGVATDDSDHHRLTPRALTDALERARGQGADARILIVNTPSNPTGGMLAREDVEALAIWCRAHGITLISDEIYAELAHGWREHISPALFYPEGCIVTGGLSKAFSAGGWRLGYAALPGGAAGARLMNALRALASEIWSSAATPVQTAAVAAYTYHPDLERYVQHAARLHGYVAHQLYETLIALGALCPRPAGGFYLYPDFAPWRSQLAALNIHTSDDLARYLLDTWDIATLPGSAFAEHPSALRLRLATSLLYAPLDARSPAEHEAALWQLLDQADTIVATETGYTLATPLALPALARAQARLTEFAHSLAQYPQSGP
ncbi:MAG TPA: aminotransferase class I/II-fold pyridoxal phosphate-dependent enzyme [Ktedonobacteraceae bacterium]|nr:aminotransferase class I/II-fold pyridoxal phosphate-dependent enzyme [Ktedonobacteraceae bacterium]